MMRGSEGLPDGDAKDEVVMSSRGVKKNDPAVAWLAPLKKKLEEARSSGASLSELREQIRAWKPDRRALADAMARNIAEGFARGAAAVQGAKLGKIKADEVAAVRGCNQHEHKPECPEFDGVNNLLGQTEKNVAEWAALLDKYKEELEANRGGATKVSVKAAEKAIKELEWQKEYVAQDLRWYKQMKDNASFVKAPIESMERKVSLHADNIDKAREEMENAFAKLRRGRKRGNAGKNETEVQAKPRDIQPKGGDKKGEEKAPAEEIDKKEAGNVGSYEERLAKAREAKTPSDFIKAMGLDMENEATEEAVGEFLRALKSRHPENLKHMGRLFKWGPHEWTQKEKNKISKEYEEILPMLSPEVVRNLTPVNIAIRRMKPNEGGEYSNGKIFYNIRASKESHVHEFFHHVHDSASDEVYDKISDYYRLRIKGNVVQTLFDGVKGFADNFATSVDANTIYAGAVYTNKKGEIERTDRRVTGDIFGPKRNRTDGLNGSEFVTAHLEKLACSKSKFTKLWNYKRNGKYYWREGFIESMRVMFNK